MTKRAHVPALDGVRGLACLLVIAFHAGALPMGWVGVDLFFALSGYLITGILLDAREAPDRARSFYARRALRIFPLYYVYVFVVIAIPALTHRAWPWNWTYWLYLSNWKIGLLQTWSADRSAVLGHLWSLAVEEQFYLVWPLLAWNVSRAALRRIALAGIVGALLCRMLLLDGGWDPATAVYVLTPCRIDAILVGACLALAPADALRAWKRGAIALGAALVALASLVIARGAFYADVVMATFGYSIVAATAALVVAAALRDGPIARAFEWRPLRAVGTYSYAMYLFHPAINLGLRGHGMASGVGLAAASIALAFVVAAISWRVVESPILRLKRFFPTGRADTAPVEMRLAA